MKIFNRSERYTLFALHGSTNSFLHLHSRWTVFSLLYSMLTLPLSLLALTKLTKDTQIARTSDIAIDGEEQAVRM